MTNGYVPLGGDGYSVELVAGVDEAGRGPLAGPVVAAAVILDPKRPIEGLDDSKKLTASRREALAVQIRARSIAWALGQAEADEIDQMNILQASLESMRRAVAGLRLTPTRVLVDGNRCPALTMPAEAIIKGDQKVAAIAAASILAKVERDRQLIELDRQFPHYGFAAHKGYPTKAHITALRQFGPCVAHRRTYAPVVAVIKASLPHCTG